MECKDFHLLINDFLDEKIENEKTIERFVEHASSCNDCKEELEMFLAVKEGIGDMDSDSNKFDYNFDKKVNKLIKYYNDEIKKNRFIKKMCRGILLLVLIIIIIILVLNYLNII